MAAGKQEADAELWGLIRTIYRSALKRLNARLAKERITFSQYSVLLALDRHGPMPMTRLSEHMLVAPANVTGLVDRMEKKGYVRRLRGKADRRLYMVEPTEQGVALFKSISGRFRSYVGSIGDGLSPSELETTVASLRKTKERVEATEEI